MAAKPEGNPAGLRVDRDQGLLCLTLNRPDLGNALSPALVEAMIDAITGAENPRLCVIRGEGKHFCTGFDLSDLEALSDGDLLWRFLRIETLLQAIHHAPYPVAAFAQGQAIGAGADLLAACWQRIATPGLTVRMPGWNFELALGTRRLTNLIGSDAARDLLIDTKVLQAEAARACGLVSEIAEIEIWPERQRQMLQRAGVLSTEALRQMFGLTLHDTRNDDLAAIVRSAGHQGLKDRIVAYRNQVRVASSRSKG